VQMVQLENGDGGKDNDSLCLYVAITILQIPLFKINGVVNQFSTRRAKERERSNFWFVLATLLGTRISFLLEIKFSRGQIATPSAVL
jgi:hypothetical protein